MKSKLYKEGVNTLICASFSDFYKDLNDFVLQDGQLLQSRIGETREIFNFKSIINNPLNRCTVGYQRNTNIFFHLAESLWVFAGRNDLEFISLFNSQFKTFSDDGNILYGAYGNRMRNWSIDGINSIDQLFDLTTMLNESPNSRRSVISLWNPKLDLQSNSNDVPCNTQLVFKVDDDKINLTIFNRSNDLHWGYVANIFQFSIMGELVALLLDKRFSKQTHISHSLHVYTENVLCTSLKVSTIATDFYTRYPPSVFKFNFINSTSEFKKRFSELDEILNDGIELLLEFNNCPDLEITKIEEKVDYLKNVSSSLYEIVYLLAIYIYYRKQLVTDNSDELRKHIVEVLSRKDRDSKFEHRDFYGLALNYFVRRISEKSTLNLEDSDLGNY